MHGSGTCRSSRLAWRMAIGGRAEARFRVVCVQPARAAQMATKFPSGRAELSLTARSCSGHTGVHIGAGQGI